jgi:dolichol-phosphate mannosyltransferase
MIITVIIPTYNEEENIEILVTLLEEKFKLFPNYIFNILFVDGNSKDNTVAFIKKAQKDFKNIKLIEEQEKSGLGGAYIKGFKFAMKELNSDYVVEMDADLQHNPDDFPKLVEKISAGFDMVIGSRYVKGGSVPKEWAIYRKFISYFGSLFARVVLRIFKVKDFTSGFRLTKVAGVLDQIEFSKIKSKGFAYKMDMLVRIYDMKAKITEVPISFGLRDRGTSKMEQRNFRDSLKVVVDFALERNKNFIKFMVVGFGGLFTDLGMFYLAKNYFNFIDNLSQSLNGAISPLALASFISGTTAMIFTFSLNNLWSFKERMRISLIKIIPVFILYSASSYVPILLRSSFIHYLEGIYGDNSFIIYSGFMAGVVFGIFWNYTVYSKIIWKKNG